MERREAGGGRVAPSFTSHPRPTVLSRMLTSHQQKPAPTKLFGGSNLSPILPQAKVPPSGKLPPSSLMPPPSLAPQPASPRGSLAPPPAPPSPAPRKKPVVQSYDLAALVREGGAAALAKVNTATLLDHLRRQGVAGARAKAKKEELVQMVVKLYQ